MKRRIVAALAAVGLCAGALIGAAPAAYANGVPGAPYVAIGDSEAAGTGNQPYVDEECLRSKKAYPVVLAGALGTPVVSAACAGATTDAVLGQIATLVAEGDLGAATQLVTVTAGINDLGWQSLLLACTGAGTPLECAQAFQTATQQIAALPAKITAILTAVRTAAPGATIVVTGYPHLFGAVADSCSIGVFDRTPVKVSAEQAAAANALIDAVNATIASTLLAFATGTGDVNIVWVDVAEDFAGHGLCDTGSRWISGLVGGDVMDNRGLHPNTAGQQAWAASILAELAG